MFVLKPTCPVSAYQELVEFGTTGLAFGDTVRIPSLAVYRKRASTEERANRRLIRQRNGFTSEEGVTASGTDQHEGYDLRHGF